MPGLDIVTTVTIKTRSLTKEQGKMKRDTLVAYQERFNKHSRVVNAAINGLSAEDPSYGRLIKLFNRQQKLSNVLFGDDISGDTIDINNQLQSFCRSVLKFKLGLGEDAPDTLKELQLEDIQELEEVVPPELVNVAGQPAPVFDANTTVQQQVMSELTTAQQALRRAHQTIVSNYKMAKTVPAVVTVDELAKKVTQAIQEINRLEF